MPYRDQARVQSWVEQFRSEQHVDTAVDVLEKDYTAGPESGLVVVTLRTMSTVTYIQPVVTEGVPKWIVTFEPRSETFDLDGVGVSQLAQDLLALANLCTYLQLKTDEALIAASS